MKLFGARKFWGYKVNRKDSNQPYSQVIAKDGVQFSLLPGKTRGEIPASLLGAGCYGKVKQALDEKRTTLAVKISNRNQFHIALNEFQILKKLGWSAKLVVTENKSYLFQNKIAGVTLKHYFDTLINQLNDSSGIKRQKIKLLLIQILLNTVTAINQLHEKRVIHNDLHLNNIMYDPKNKKITIIDMGRAYSLTNNTKGKRVAAEIQTDFRKFLYMLQGTILNMNLKDSDLMAFKEQLDLIINPIIDKKNKVLNPGLFLTRQFMQLYLRGYMTLTLQREEKVGLSTPSYGQLV